MFRQSFRVGDRSDRRTAGVRASPLLRLIGFVDLPDVTRTAGTSVPFVAAHKLRSGG